MTVAVCEQEPAVAECVSTPSTPAKIQYRRFASKRRFGVEMEVSNTKTREQIRDLIHKVSAKREIHITDWAQSNGNNYWHVKWDSTCGPLGKGKDNGWEIATYIASGFKDVVHIAQVANALRAGGVEVTDNCGLHIHVDIQEFTPEQAAVLVARWVKIEHSVLQIVPARRHTSKYCRMLGEIGKAKLDFKRQYDPKKFWQLVRPTNYHVHENNQKKVALNMVNYSAAQGGYQQRSTVELRLPEGTLFGADIRNWVRCFVNFVELSKTAPMPTELAPAADPIEELMQFFGLEDGDSFYLLSLGLYEAKVWLLKRMIAFGSKEVQTAAKTKLAIVAGTKK